MKSIRIALMLAALPLGFAVAQAQGSAQDKTEVAEHAAETNKTCGTHIAFSVDYASFAGLKDDPKNANQQSAWAYFANVTDALNSICGTDAGKAMVAKIKAVTVSHGPAEAESMAGGTFHYVVPTAGASYPTIVQWLNKHLQ